MKKNNNSGSRLTDGKNSNYYLNSKSIYAVGSSSLLNEDIRKKKKARFDFLLPAAVLDISVFGVFIIYSATRYSMPNNVTDPMYYFKRQGFWLIGAFVVFIAFQFINYRFISRFSWAVFIVIILLLIWVLVFGYEVNNSKSWVDLKFFSVQPSEFAKILMVIETA